MDEDRIKGAPRKAKGAVKPAAGSITGDAALQQRGTARNAAGGAKDTVRDLAHDGSDAANR